MDGKMVDKITLWPLDIQYVFSLISVKWKTDTKHPVADHSQVWDPQNLERKTDETGNQVP